MSLLFDCHVSLLPIDLWPYGIGPVAAWSATFTLMLRADCRMTCSLMASGLWDYGLMPDASPQETANTL